MHRARRSRRGFRGWVPTLVCMLLAGCSTAKRDNVQALRWDAVLARGAIHEFSAAPIAYSRVNIDLEKIVQVLRIQMPDGKVLQTSAPLETFWPYTMYGRRAKLPAKFHQGTRSFDVIFPGGWGGTIGGYSLEFENGRLAGLGIGALRPATPETICPAIGDSTASELCILPLTEAQLIQLFGPYRDKIVVNGFDVPLSAPAALDGAGSAP
jgi:hypothetical protein